MTHKYQQMIEKQLANMGGLYSYDDLLYLIHTGNMQSFCVNESWVVTQVCVYPRKTAVHIVMAVGEMDDILEIEKKIEAWSKEIGAEILIASARAGWRNHAKTHDRWKHLSDVYIRGV